MFVLYWAKISGERLQELWSSGFVLFFLALIRYVFYLQIQFRGCGKPRCICSCFCLYIFVLHFVMKKRSYCIYMYLFSA